MIEAKYSVSLWEKYEKYYNEKYWNIEIWDILKMRNMKILFLQFASLEICSCFKFEAILKFVKYGDKWSVLILCWVDFLVHADTYYNVIELTIVSLIYCSSCSWLIPLFAANVMWNKCLKMKNFLTQLKMRNFDSNAIASQRFI